MIRVSGRGMALTSETELRCHPIPEASESCANLHRKSTQKYERATRNIAEILSRLSNKREQPTAKQKGL